MSGGSLDYAYFKIKNIAEDIVEKMNDESYLDCSEEKKDAIKKLIFGTLGKLSDIEFELYNLEMFFSGDIGEDDYIERLNQLNR